MRRSCGLTTAMNTAMAHLDIANHDVLIGEQNSSTEHRTYRYYDKSNAYPTWDSWDSTFGGAVLENGGSLYAASFASQCSSSGLFSTSCSNYDAAYLTQQCDANALYSSECTGYEAHTQRNSARQMPVMMCLALVTGTRSYFKRYR